MADISAVDSKIEIYGAEPYRNALMQNMQDDESISYMQSTIVDTEKVSSGKNIVIIMVEFDKVTIIYDSSVLTDSEILYTAQELASQIMVLQINETQYPTYEESTQRTELVDVSSSADQIEKMLIPLISIVFIIALMLANTSISSLSTDAIAGDRERGTFDMLRLSGTRISSIVLGKYAFIVLVGMVILAVETIALALGVYICYPEQFQIVVAQVSGNILWFLPLLLCLFDIALLTAALYMVLSASFENVKQVGAYASIVQIVLSLFTYAPNVVNVPVLNYLPISNLWGVLRKTLANECTIAFTASSTCIALAIACFCLYYARNTLEKDTKQ